MKRLCTTLAVLFGFVSIAWAQQVGPKYVLESGEAHLTAPISTMPLTPVVLPDDFQPAAGQKQVPEWFVPRDTPAGFVDEAWNPNAPLTGSILGPEPFQSFDGPGVNGSAPSDANIDVGPNHIIATVNSVTQIFDKVGNSLLGPFPLNDLWDGFGGPCEIDNDGDPVVVYDHFNDRWILTQFAVTAGDHLCVAVSTGSDPTGSYHLYGFDFIAFPDYPKFGLTQDVLLATARSFPGPDMQAAAFDYLSMLDGLPVTAIITSVSDVLGAVDGFLPFDTDGDVIVGPAIANSDLSANFIGFIDGPDTIELLKLDPDFDTPANSTLTSVSSIAVDAFDSNFCGTFFGCIDQPAPGTDLHAIPFFMMHRAAARMIGSDIHLVVNHTVDVDATDRAGVRWYELTNTGAGGEFEVVQTGTHSPDTNDRWMGSITMNGNGDIILGYSVSGNDPGDVTPPDIRYAAQTSGGGGGVLNVAETNIHEGGGVQTGGLLRWGDYTAMVPDPVDPSAVWYINQYLPANGSFNWNTRIAGIALEEDTDAPDQITDLAVTGTAAVTQGSQVMLQWTAVGDDGGTGTATAYDLRYSDAGPINDGNFDAATQVMGVPAPQEAGNVESFTVAELAFDTEFWFAIKAIDEFANEGPASNSPSETTGPAPDLGLDPTEISVMLEPEQQTVETLTITNNGPAGSTLNFEFPGFAAASLLRNTPADQHNNVAPVVESTDHPKGDDPFGGIGNPIILGAGGPDGFGYEWIDSNEPGGPAYNFTDISGTGTEHAINDDFAGTTSVNVALPFSFPYYGEDQNSVNIDNNGMLFFNGAAGNYFSNAQIPSATDPDGIIAPFWDDLNPDAGACTIHSQDNGGEFIVQFTNCERFSDAGSVMTFQVVLTQQGQIYFYFEDMSGTLDSATLGIENGDGSDGLQVAFNAAYVENGLAVLISATPPIIADVDPFEGSLGSGESQEVDVTVSAEGLLPGDYEEDLVLLSNDPGLDPTTLIPVSLDVEGGEADIAVDPAAIDFGDVFVGDMSTMSFDIENEGNGVLTVSDVTSDNGDFTTDFGGSFMLNPGETETINVTFAPSAEGAIAGNIDVASTDADENPISVAVSGNGTAPPVIDTDPDALTADVQIGDSETQTLTILNNGDADLDWEATFVAATTPDGMTLVPSDVAFSNLGSGGDGSGLGLADPDATFAPGAFAPGTEIYQVDDGSSENSIGLTAGGDMMWINVFQVVDGAENIFSIASAFGNDASGINNGDPITYYLYDDPNNDGDPTDGVLLTSFDTAVAGVDTDAFLTEQIEETTVEGVFFVGVLLQNQPAGTFPGSLDQNSGLNGASWVVGNSTPGGFDDNNLGNNDVAPINIDTIAGLEGNWLLRADGTGAGIVAYSPDSGTVPPGGSQDVDVTFDASDLDVGSYPGNTELASNDPVNPIYNVPTTLNVTAAPFPFVLDPTQIDVDLFTGEMTTEILNVANIVDETRRFTLFIEGESGPDPVAPNPLTATQRYEYDKMAAALAEGSEAAPSMLADPNQDSALSSTLPGFGMLAPTGVTAWGYSGSFNGAFNDNLITFDLGEPSLLAPLAGNTMDFFAGDYVPGDDSQFYVSEAGGGANNFYSVDPATGATTLIGVSNAADSFTELAGDPTDGTLYASTSTGLYTIDPATGAATFIANFGGDFAGGDIMIAIAIDDAGVMYGHEILNDVIYTIDKATGVATLLGPTGVNANFAQGMDYDPITGQLYMAWYQGGGVGGLRTVDTTTGATTLVGPFQGDEITFLAIPGTPPIHFLDVSLIDGILNPNRDVDVEVYFDATGLIEGLYTADIIVQSFVAGEPAETVPVSMTVDADPDIDVDPLALDFGIVFRNGQGGPEQVTIANLGLGYLDVSDISVDNPVFDLILPTASTTIPPLSAIVAEVTFNPTEVGVQNGILTIASDDPNDPVVEVTLTGEGVPEPVISTDPTSFDLQAYVGQEYDQTLTVSNVGDEGGVNLDWVLSEENIEGPSPTGATFFYTILEEDFEGGIPGDWTVIDNTGNGGWALASDFGRANETGGSGEAASIDSDALGSVDLDTELITPELPISDNLVLSHQTRFRPWFLGNPEMFDIDITTDGGATWTNIANFTQDDEVLEELLTFDLAPYLNGMTGTFMIRWHYYDANFEYYAQIDDVKIQAPLTFLTEDVMAGSLAAGESQDITLSFMAPTVPGLYEVDLVFSSNDPVNPQWAVPVDFEVISSVNVVADTDQMMDSLEPLDSVHPGQEFVFPVTVESLDYLEVLSYQFALHFDPAVVEATGATFEGTLSEGLETSVTIDNETGFIGVAAADDEGAAPIRFDPAVVEGAGVLVYIHMKGGSGMHGTTGIEFQDSFQFNEGAPAATTIDGEVENTVLYGDASLNVIVNSFDASVVLRHATNDPSIDLSPAAHIQGDVTGNGDVTAFDASFILRWATGDITCFPVEDGCDVATKRTVESNGVLAWGEPENDAAADLIRLPLQLSNVEGPINSLTLTLPVDSRIMSVEGMDSTLPEDWQATYAIEDDVLRVVMAGVSPLGNSDLATINVRWLTDDAQLTWTGPYFLNEKQPTVLRGVDVGTVPDTFVLGNNYPNPFNPVTTITYELPEQARVTLTIYNALGQKVRTLVDADQNTGRYKVRWDSRSDAGTQVASGTYLYRIEAGDFVATKTLILIK